MTTAMTTNYDILNNAKVSANSVSKLSEVTSVDSKKTSDFSNIFDKTQKNTQIHTIGDIKNTLQISDMSDEMASFKEFLADATSEANVETSLDLTLARDINDIISQLKGAIEEQEQEIIPTTDNNSSLMSDIKTAIENAAPVVFEQALSLADKAAEFDSTGTIKSLIDTASDYANNLTSNNNLLEDIEELALETDTEEVDTTTNNLETGLDDDALKELNIESITSDADTSDNGSFMNRQSPEEHSAKVVIGHQIEKFEIPSNTTQTTQLQNNSTDINPSKIIEQITKQLEQMNGSKVNIVLNPQALGRINLQITNTQEGLSAQFTVSSNEIRDLLMKGLDGLKEALNMHGVSVDNISIKLNETEKSSYNPDWADKEGSRGGNKDQGQQKHQEKDKEQFEKTIVNIFKKNGNV